MITCHKLQVCVLFLINSHPFLWIARHNDNNKHMHHWKCSINKQINLTLWKSSCLRRQDSNYWPPLRTSTKKQMVLPLLRIHTPDQIPYSAKGCKYDSNNACNPLHLIWELIMDNLVSSLSCVHHLVPVYHFHGELRMKLALLADSCQLHSELSFYL